MGGTGKTIEINETFMESSSARRNTFGPAIQWRNTVLALVERGGSVRTFHITGTTMAELLPVIRFNVNPRLRYDGRRRLVQAARHRFANHETVNHTKKEYVRRLLFAHCELPVP